MSGARTVTEMIAEIVRRETRYLRHYEAQVLKNDDELNKGRVLVSVPALARFSQDEGIWAYPRYIGFSQITPPVDSWVELYFMNGRIERPVYLNGVTELTATELKEYSGTATNVVFESPDRKTRIVYDEDAKEVKMSTDQTKLTLEAGQYIIKIDSAGITLQSGDALGWLPNILSTDPVTGIPHGGPTAGIVKLKGA